MYDRFTDRARKILQRANREAQNLSHEYIGTEHILLGMLQEDSGHAITLLKQNLGDVDPAALRERTIELAESPPISIVIGSLPQTPRAKNVIMYAMEEARELNCNYVGSGHLLLGLLRETEGIAFTVLQERGITADTVRDQCKENMAGDLTDEKIQTEEQK